MPSKHAVLSASKSGKWVNCSGSVKAEESLGDIGSTRAADEGTVAHWIASKILIGEELPEFGDKFVVEDGEVYRALDGDEDSEEIAVIEYTREMLDYVRIYTNEVDRYSVLGVELEVEIGGLTGEAGATGRLDAITQRDDEFQIHDLKYGFTPVPAQDNTQEAIYAWGGVEWLKKTAGIPYDTTIRLVIHQPRLGVIDECVYTLREIEDLWAQIQQAAKKTRTHPDLRTPGDHCHKGYCRAAADCSARDKWVKDIISEDLDILPDESLYSEDPLERVAVKMEHIPAIRKWCDAVEADAKRRALELGEKIPGFKVVEGKAGARMWVDGEKAEETFKSMRIKHELMYKYDLISPTQAEKLYKEGGIGPRQWPKLKDHITRKDSNNQLVPESDKRQAIEVKPDVDLLPDDLIEEEMIPVGKEVVEADEDDFSDLF